MKVAKYLQTSHEKKKIEKSASQILKQIIQKHFMSPPPQIFRMHSGTMRTIGRGPTFLPSKEELVKVLHYIFETSYRTR
jgi:hypothetical protein